MEGTRPASPANARYRWEGSTIIVSWDAVAGADYYKIYYDDFFDSSCRLSSSGNPSFCEELATNVTGTSYTHTDPDPSRNYYWITACNSAGCSEIDGDNPAELVGAVPGPDLIVEMPTVSADTLAAGVSFTLSATVRNQGDRRSRFTILRYYRSPDTTISTDDVEVGTDSVSSLDTAEEGEESIRLTVPDSAGTYYYGACVDSVSDESDTTNNCSGAVGVTVGSGGQPDLVVETPVLSNPTPVAGDSFPLSATVRNQGSGPSVPGVLRFYRSTDPSITTSDTVVAISQYGSLSASGTEVVSEILPGISDTGTYYLGACVAPVSEEIDTTNNCSPSVAVTVIASTSAPDLVVDMGGGTGTSVAGTSFDINLAVRNQSTGDTSASTTLRYYRSTDAVISDGDAEIVTDSVGPLGGSNRISRHSKELIAPSTKGTYHYGACVDAVAGETTTTNNCSSPRTIVITALGADLVVTRVNVPTVNPIVGEEFSISIHVENQGDARALSPTARFYRSTDAAISSSDTEIGALKLGHMAPSQHFDGGSIKISTAAPAIASTYYYGACIDSADGESDTTNNCSSAEAVAIIGAAVSDLVIESFRIEAPEVYFPSLPMYATVRNQGPGLSASTPVSFYLSDDATITTNDMRISGQFVKRLSPSENSTAQVTTTAESAPGTYYYGACVEAVAGESDTTNNCSTAVTVSVGAAPTPDLVVDQPTVSDSTPDAGATFTLSATVHNQGSGSSDSTTLRYYRSTDSAITSADTSVGTDAVGGLNASGTNAESITLTAPDTPGTYHYGACVDAVSDESDPRNNCSSAVTIAVGATPAPAGDYDTDNDGLIEISNLSQLNAIRWDLDGDGESRDSGYAQAFPGAVAGMGCPDAGCSGYELTSDLDFDTNGNGQPDAGDAYWNNGAGWDPIGRLDAAFDGGGYSISNLYIHRDDQTYTGLFASTASEGIIRQVQLDVGNVNGGRYVGALVGFNSGTISASYATGNVDGTYGAGGLAGFNSGTVSASYAAGNVSGVGSSGGLFGSRDGTGGLVGDNSGTIGASYATGSVSGIYNTGGLVGNNYSVINASYSTGNVDGVYDVGGLVGVSGRNAETIASYWNTQTSGQTASSGGAGKTTQELQDPIGYTGIYTEWNVDLDGDDQGDDPWDFGTSAQYPMLRLAPSAGGSGTAQRI